MQYGPHYVIIMCAHLTSDSTASTFNRSSQRHQQHRHLASYLQWKLSAWWWCEYAILSVAMELEDLNEEIMASKKARTSPESSLTSVAHVLMDSAELLLRSLSSTASIV